ncbi:MAG TPA: DUF2141 domain-containing protein [Terracidiphilus sp.]|nr:DUF2141 domain-containing protein [Terracidiphilus sp.]
MTATLSLTHPSIRNAFKTRWPRAAAVMLLVLAASAAYAQPNPAAGHDCTLRIHVDGFRNTRGNLGTIIFTSPDGWPEDENKCLRHGPAPIDKSTRTADAEWRLPPGNYGVAAIHDENSNHKLDRNFLGIPKEGFGFANNPHVGLSAPPFSAAVVHVACPATAITIHLIYK